MLVKVNSGIDYHTTSQNAPMALIIEVQEQGIPYNFIDG
jgi:hypothetical protein